METPQIDKSADSNLPWFDSSKLAQRIADIHGTVPIRIIGQKFDPAVADLLRKFQIARSVPASDMFRCK